MDSDQLAYCEVSQRNEKAISTGGTGKLMKPPHNPVCKNKSQPCEGWFFVFIFSV